MGRKVPLSGFPASGKSTLAVELASVLGFALISKDEILATIFAALSGQPGDQGLSMRSGQAAWAVFWHLASRCPDVVLDTNLKFADPYEREQVSKLTGSIVEVRCQVPLTLAQARYAERAKLRPAAQRFTELTDEQATRYAEAIGVGPLLQVDTTAPVDVAALADQVRRLLDMR
jgi:predicted kinase